MRYTLHVNGRPHEVEAAPEAPLLSVLRDELGLTGAHYGCGQGVCGACTVLVGGKAVPSCTMRVAEAAGREIVTIEGLPPAEGRLHPVQAAFVREDAMQCGYCTPGMIVASVALLSHSPHPDEEEIRDALVPHLCRCGTYGRAIRAVQAAAREMATREEGAA